MGCGASTPAPEALAIPAAQPLTGEVPTEPTPATGAPTEPEPPTEKSQVEQLEEAISKLHNEDPAVELEGTIAVRKLISDTQGPCLPIAIERNVTGRLVELLHSADPGMQYEAAWALTNIASGNADQTKNVVDSGAVPVLVNLLSSPHTNVAEQALWALGNVSGEPSFCSSVLSAGAVPHILDLVTRDGASNSMVETGSWTLSNLCHGKPTPEIHELDKAVPVLATLLTHPSQEVQTNACCAFAHLSTGSNTRIQAVLDAGALPPVVELLKQHDAPMAVQALKVVGNVVSGDEAQTQAALNLGVLPELEALLNPSKEVSLQKEAAWAISNITAGTPGQVQQVIDAGCVEPLLERLENGQPEVQRECNWALSNATCGADDQVQRLLHAGVDGTYVRLLCQILGSNDVQMQPVALDALHNLLKLGPEAGVEAKVREFGGVIALQRLANDGGNETAAQLCNEFFNEDHLVHDRLTEVP